jgi:hypothetical protein
MKNTFSTLLPLRKQQPIGARSEATKSRREGKALRNRVLAKRTGNEFCPNRETRPPVTGKQTGKELCPNREMNRERIPPIIIGT